MSISNISLSNSQQMSISNISTDKKTVHKQDINNLKKELKSISNLIDDLSKKSNPKTMNSLSFMSKNIAIYDVKKNISKGQTTLISLKGKVNDLKGKINSSSYKHNASKMQSLDKFENQLNNLSSNLKSSKSNIKNIDDMDKHNHHIMTPKYQEAEKAQNDNLKKIHQDFMKANPHYSEGGMVK
ncbi:hypothetical protein [Providencia sneebia]|uniref:Uncharacterized protein n=1 Tax=Providencia sneebia DSM 19967 TaxID=1141660 RepID=K8WHP7_9GAMM|nr:hypothetical protein [Providencia sneebia]EKT59466.1 hypothetical protein OO7_05774 [Providencia sneebia DSM 19967]